MPRCLSEGVDIFLKSADRQGESGHDVRVSRSAPWMARVGDPVIMRTAVSLFIRKFTPGDATSRRDVPFAAGVRGFFTNFQFIIKPRCIHTGAACLLFQFPNVSVVLRNGSVGGEESGLGDVHQHHLLPLLMILVIGECLILYLDVIF
jgi:hypothetical protein